MDLYLGIDTSNYTTSLAVTDNDGKLLADERKLLEVKKGKVGLRQSEAVFQHIKNIPVLCERIFKKIDNNKIRAISVSAKPRPEEDSYMPVFLVGLNTAKILAQAWDIPLILTTHQEGHIMAGLWSVGMPEWDFFNVIHISGGTTEILEVKLQINTNQIMTVKKIGGTGDLHAGQFIDRIGVNMGLPFPSGPSLEKLAQESSSGAEFPISVKGLSISFSGPESHGQRLIKKGEKFSEIARGVENCLLKTLEKVIVNVYYSNNSTNFLFVGGVASNSYLRDNLTKSLNSINSGINLLFAQPTYSSDNAVGVSLIRQSMGGGVVGDV
ncbi:MAG: O-sialoglycoprotein endopeptidase [Peptococcales bacterium]|jgi:N6-L-threonylcarbamoyladenine synthase